MKRRFNTTGLCVPDMHYMVDLSDRINMIVKMVEDGYYFTINRPRQYGKTTILNAVANKLREKYIVIKTSFEGVSDIMFESEEKFCSKIFEVFAGSMEFTDPELACTLNVHQKSIFDYNSLSREISAFISKMSKNVMLLIDEVDKSSNSRTFLKFLGLLRNKYLAKNAREDITFQSVILSGVHDIKNLKLAIRDESDSRFNSPWNIAEDFLINMSFNAFDIKSMLDDYSEDSSVNFDTEIIAKEIYKYTNGYPYLVSRICKIIDERMGRNWTVQGISNAVREILKEKSTLFDDVIKNIENNSTISNTAYEILVEGRKVNFNQYAYETGIIYGILSEKDGKLAVNNKIFEELIYNYLIEKKYLKDMASRFTSVNEEQFIENGSLNMENALLKFQEFMYQEYRKEDEKFYETNGRLIFLAYLKPILNGRGFSFVEAETRENRRMDVVITFGNTKYIVELKIWNGEKYEEKGLVQLTRYLDIQKLEKGYMVVFNLNENKTNSAEWIEIGGKKIFEVIV